MQYLEMKNIDFDQVQKLQNLNTEFEELQEYCYITHEYEFREANDTYQQMLDQKQKKRHKCINRHGIINSIKRTRQTVHKI